MRKPRCNGGVLAAGPGRLATAAIRTTRLQAAYAWVVVPLWVAVCVASLRAQTPTTGIRIVTDQPTYNAGSTVRVRIAATGEKDWGGPLDLIGTLRYAGETKAILSRVPLVSSFATSGAPHSTDYREFWKVPRDAHTGKYEVDIEALDRSHQSLFKTDRPAASFGVHRKVIQIERIELDQTFYTSGDPVAATVKLRNTGDHPFSGLRVEFSKRYWPWTAQSSERQGLDYKTLSAALSLPAETEKQIRATQAAVAEVVKQPTVAQYAVVVWDQARAHVLDIAFTPIVFINPPGINSPRPYAGPAGYPMQYLHPDLNSINTTNYRHFYPPELDSPAIAFDSSRTLFASGSDATVKFSVRNPTVSPWRHLGLRIQLSGNESAELVNRDEVLDKEIDLEPNAPPLAKTAQMRFHGAGGGLCRFEVKIEDASGAILASNTLELGFNPLPESILIFCAHPDDEGAHSGVIRAAVENRIPIHFVYFTSGDAGSCDRYYQHFCEPSEALNFGALRMDEARASVGHLGVPPEAIEFFGLPDGGSGEVWNHVQSSSPYLAVLLGVDRAPYEGLVAPNLPYARQAVVEKVKEVIRRFKPAVIYTGHPDERHVDHRTGNWFVVKAMQELLAEGGIRRDTILLTDQSYGAGPQAHAPYRYQKNVFYVSGEAMALGQEAAWFYQSQGGNAAEGNLRTFDKLRREQVHWQILDWQEHQGWNENR